MRFVQEFSESYMTDGCFVKVAAETEEAADTTFKGLLKRVNEKHIKYVFIEIGGPGTVCRVFACLN